MVTDDMIARLRRLHEQATPGPWTVGDPDWPEGDVPIYTPAGAVCASPDDGVRGSHKRANAELIVEARNALPALLDVAEAAADARRLLDRLYTATAAKGRRAQIERVCRDVDAALARLRATAEEGSDAGE